tara:strand:+ start:7163 stop:7753 length:591 start_codon:yes stop_codon:yes gene_type:complete
MSSYGGGIGSTAATTVAGGTGAATAASWVNPAMFGLQALAMVGSARNQAKQSSAQIRANNTAIKDITAQIGMTDEAAVAQGEVAQGDYYRGWNQSGQKYSNMFDDLFQKHETNLGIQGFAHSGGLERSTELMGERMNQEFETGRENLLDSLDKSLANISEWQQSEKFRLEADKTKLKAQNRVLRKSNTTWKALGFG